MKMECSPSPTTLTAFAAYNSKNLKLGGTNFLNSQKMISKFPSFLVSDQQFYSKKRRSKNKHSDINYKFIRSAYIKQRDILREDRRIHSRDCIARYASLLNSNSNRKIFHLASTDVKEAVIKKENG